MVGIPKSCSLHSVTQGPNTDYLWMDRTGNPVPPPPQQQQPHNHCLKYVSNGGNSFQVFILAFEVEALLCPGDNLGIIIRGGAEYGVGIFVVQVDQHSVAQKLGLEVKITVVENLLKTVISLVTKFMR